MSGRRITNLIGQRKGFLTVIALDHRASNRNYWLCKCDCGEEIIVNAHNLLHGLVQSCGCIQEKATIGQIFGRLQVIELDHRVNSKFFWKCQCECGNETVVSTANLETGNTKSCGCLHREKLLLQGDKTCTDLTGKRVGKLLVLQRNTTLKRNRKYKCAYWDCICDCGRKKVISARILKNGRVTSCGCDRTTKSIESGLNALIRRYIGGAEKRGIPFDLPTDVFIGLTKGNCFYCGKPPSQSIKTNRDSWEYIYNGIDRLDSSKGYTIENCVSCCKDCNMAKMAMTQEEFYLWVDRVHEHIHSKDRDKIEMV